MPRVPNPQPSTPSVHGITLIGLGPATEDSLSVEALKALESATNLILRTSRHPAAEDLKRRGIRFSTLDSEYESAESFNALYETLAMRVLDSAKSGDVAYAVPGHPLMAEESAKRILARAEERGIPVRVIGSASFVEPVLAALGLTLGDGLLLLDALSLDSVPSRPDVGILIYQVHDRETASRTKLALMREYPSDFEVMVIRAAGVPALESVETVPLHRLDRVETDHLTSVYVPPLPKEMCRRTFADLVEVMARLRAVGGCPWDREQDHKTLKRYLIEECYEAIEAIDHEDMDSLAEEMGDVLLQVVFHAQIEAEAGVFTIDDVIAHIVDKLNRRHPHVFGDTAVADSDEVLRNWERLKRAEKEPGWRESILDGVPAGLPALMRALEISKRAVKVGFEWERFEDVIAKMDEEIGELRSALESGDAARIESEIGDLLFTIVNVARWQKIDPEDSLRSMLERFTARFQFIERSARERGRALSEMPLAEMDALWNEAKSLDI